MNTIEPGVLRVGCYDKYFRKDQHSLTMLREPPAYWKWVDNCDDPAKVDVVLATQNSGGHLLGSKHPRRVLYLQECTEFHKNRELYMYERFDLVLSNDKFLVEHPLIAGKVRYQTLFGTWLEKRDVPKTKALSMLAGTNNFLTGHRVRHEVAAMKQRGELPLLDVYGTILGGRHEPDPHIAYDEYRFNLAIENASYPWWFTEKLFNCWAAKVVPVFWGCPDFSPLRQWGFDTNAKFVFTEPSEVRGFVDGIADDGGKAVYEDFIPLLEDNFNLIHRMYAHEITLYSTLTEFFGFERAPLFLADPVLGPNG